MHKGNSRISHGSQLLLNGKNREYLIIGGYYEKGSQNALDAYKFPNFSLDWYYVPRGPRNGNN